MKNLTSLLAASLLALAAAMPARADLTLEEKAAAERALELAAIGYTEERCQERFALMAAFTGAVRKSETAAIAETGRAFDAFDGKDPEEKAAIAAAFDKDFTNDAPAVIAHIKEMIAAEHPCDK